MSQVTYTLGIDPAKRKFTACLISPARELFAPRDFPCSAEGFARLEADLAAAMAGSAPGSLLVVGIEASASCDDNLLAFLGELRHRLPLTAIRVDSAQVKHFGAARPSRTKTDSADARRIAQFTRQYADELDRFELSPEAQAMQRVVNERLALAGELVAARNRLRDRLIAAFPEFEEVFPDPATPLALAVLQVVPTAAAAARKRPATLEALQARKHGNRVGPDRAQKLVLLARTSIASATSQSEENAVRRQIAQIELLRAHIAETEAELAAYIAPEPAAEAQQPADRSPGAPAPEPVPLSLADEIRLVDTIPGIALVGASAIVLRSRGISRFTSAKALAAQLGTCPSRSQTGSSRDTSHLTSRGDRLTRGVLYQLTLSATQNDPAMAFHRWHAATKGLLEKQAACACMNRMARIAFGVVKNRTGYDPLKAVENIRTHHADLWKEFLQNNQKWAEKVAKLQKEELT